VQPTIASEDLLGAAPPQLGPGPLSSGPFGSGPFRSGRKPRTALLGLVTVLIALAGSRAVTTSVTSWMDSPAVAVSHISKVGPGPYAFVDLHPSTGAPVTYPCQPIPIEVNSKHAPLAYEEFVTTAIRHVSDASGMTFDYLGHTGERDFGSRLTATSSRPVLVAWAPPGEVPSLTGDIAGLGGSSPAETDDGSVHYVSGVVLLDSSLFDRLADEPTGEVAAQAILDHEFAHVLGLGHVSDLTSLMQETYAGQSGYGPGDLQGLAALGRAACR
jgi:hypothetical protein